MVSSFVKRTRPSTPPPVAATLRTSHARTRVKFCGITRAADARIAVECGVDALGFVFDSKSARTIRPEDAQNIAQALPPFVSVVALFRDADSAKVRQVLNAFRPDFLQFHGEESPEFCMGFPAPYIKAVPMSEPQDLEQWATRHASARALLLDSHQAGAVGGTGKAFDWSLLIPLRGKPVVLAGGLNPENVVRAITMARPYAVDVSSGIESAPGIKDPERMREFIRQVRHADAHRPA